MSGTFHAAHRSLIFGRCCSRSGEPANLADLLRFDTDSTEHRILEGESTLTAASTSGCKDVVPPGPLRSNESSLPRHKRRNTRRCDTTELHKGVGLVVERRLWPLRFHDHRLHGQMPFFIPLCDRFSTSRDESNGDDQQPSGEREFQELIQARAVQRH